MLGARSNALDCGMGFLSANELAGILSAFDHVRPSTKSLLRLAGVAVVHGGIPLSRVTDVTSEWHASAKPMSKF